MKTSLISLLCLLGLLLTNVEASFAQSAQAYFNTAGNLYVNGKSPEALASVTEGMKKFPADAKLKALYDKLNEEKKDQDKKEQQQKQDQQNKDKEDKEKQDKEKEEQEKKEQEKKDQEKKDEDKKSKEQKDKEQQEKEQKEKDGKEKEKKDQQEQNKEEEKDNKKENNNKSPQLAEKLKDMKISEDKAKMILEAMKNQEVQYLQQNKRKSTKARDKGKPDW